MPGWSGSGIRVKECSNEGGKELPIGICLSLLSPFAGRMTDRFGPGPVLTFGAVVIGIASLLLILLAEPQSPAPAARPCSR